MKQKPEISFDIKRIWKDPIWKFRIIFFLFWVIAYTFGMNWLGNHPEYISYDPTAIKKQADGQLSYIIKECPDYPPLPFQKLENCTFSIGSPPPAYYIWEWYSKFRPYFFWGGSAYIFLWCLANRKNIFRWVMWLQKIFGDENDKKSKKPRNHK